MLPVMTAVGRVRGKVDGEALAFDGRLTAGRVEADPINEKPLVQPSGERRIRDSRTLPLYRVVARKREASGP